MISAKEAREISKKNKEILTEVAIVEVLPEIEELIKRILIQEMTGWIGKQKNILSMCMLLKIH